MYRDPCRVDDAGPKVGQLLDRRLLDRGVDGGGVWISRAATSTAFGVNPPPPNIPAAIAPAA
jgi:hypothetical protein